MMSINTHMPRMMAITPAVVRGAGRVETIVCHNDFDGLASAAKWLLGGVEPYAGCDDDARAIDTRVGELSAKGRRMDLALRGAPSDDSLRFDIDSFFKFFEHIGIDLTFPNKDESDFRQQTATRLFQGLTGGGKVVGTCFGFLFKPAKHRI